MRARHLRDAGRRPRRWPVAVVVATLAVVALVAVVAWWHGGTGIEEPGQVVDMADAETDTTGEASTDEAVVDGDGSSLARMLDVGEVSSIELIGDSITAGYGTDGYAMPTAATGTQVILDVDGHVEYETPSDVRCWANDLREYAAGRGVTSFVNKGICGWTMHDLATYKELYVDDADVIFVMLGTNDTVNHMLERFRQDSEESLAYLATRCELLVVMTPPETDWTRSGYTAYFTPEDTAEVLDELCERYGYLQVSNLDVIELDTDLVNADDVHPTTKGSDAIWANIRDTLGL